MAERYVGVPSIAEAFGVSRHAVHKWRARYPPDSSHPFPTPDVDVDGAPGWLPHRLEEIMQWRDGLPGRGAGGGRPSASVAEFLTEAAKYDFTRDEALRTLATFGEEFPEKTEAEVAEWIVAKWRE